MEIYTMREGHPLWEKTKVMASTCSWGAASVLSTRMETHDFVEWERVMAAVEDGNLVGFCAFTAKDRLPEGYDCTPFISLVFVDEAYRGNRLSEKLIDHTIKYAKELGYKTVYLKSEHRGLYEKYGFEKLGEFVPAYGIADQLFKKDI